MKALEIFDRVAVLRDAFDLRTKQLAKRREEERRQNERAYKPGDFLRKAEEESKAYYKKEMEAARESFQKQFDSLYNAEITRQKARILGRPDTQTMAFLQALEGVPVTEYELKCIAENYRGRSVWTDRVMKKLAEENGINTRGWFDPSPGAVLEVLDNLQGKAAIFLSAEGKERDEYPTLAALHDSTLSRLEDSLLSGTDPGFSPQKQAMKILHRAAQSPDFLTQGKTLAQGFRQSSDAVQMAIIDLIESGKAPKLYSEVLDSLDVDPVKREMVEQKKRAERAMQTIHSDSTFYDMAKAVYAAGGTGNPYIGQMLEKAFPGDIRVKSVMEALATPTARTAQSGENDSNMVSGAAPTE